MLKLLVPKYLLNKDARSKTWRLLLVENAMCVVAFSGITGVMKIKTHVTQSI